MYCLLQYKWLVFGKWQMRESTSTDLSDFQVSIVEDSHGWLRCKGVVSLVQNLGREKVLWEKCSVNSLIQILIKVSWHKRRFSGVHFFIVLDHFLICPHASLVLVKNNNFLRNNTKIIKWIAQPYWELVEERYHCGRRVTKVL